MNTVAQNVEIAEVLSNLNIGAALICKINGEVVPAEYQYFDTPNDQIEVIVSFEGELVTLKLDDVTIPPSLLKNAAKQKEVSEKEHARAVAAAKKAAERAEREARLAVRRAESEKRNQERAAVADLRRTEREQLLAAKREQREQEKKAKYEAKKAKIAERDSAKAERQSALAERKASAAQRKNLIAVKRQILDLLKAEGISRKEFMEYVKSAA